MPLTDAQIKKAKPSAKPQRLYDERGLYLEVAPSGQAGRCRALGSAALPQGPLRRGFSRNHCGGQPLDCLESLGLLAGLP